MTQKKKKKMTTNCTNFLKRLSWFHKNFWGNRYRIFKNDKVIKEILVYKKRIYIIKEDDII